MAGPHLTDADRRGAVPFTRSWVEVVAKSYPTPLYVYDEQRIRQTARQLKAVMDKAGVSGFRNYFAVKALPNPAIVHALAEEGMGVDCSSLAELAIAEHLGLNGEAVMFSSNNTAPEEFAEAVRLRAIINFDDISMLQPFLDKFGPPAIGCCRYNPGDIDFGNTANEAIIGSPREAKYGMTTEQIIDAYRLLKAAGVKQFGLHTMLLSNELDYRQHVRIADALFALAAHLSKTLGIQFTFINLGGGIGVPYEADEPTFDVSRFAEAIAQHYKQHALDMCGRPNIVMENGRYITAEAGYIVTQVRTIKRTHKTYVGVDASMSDLMRPGVYGAYHHISLLGDDGSRTQEVIDVVGSLCENNDKFAIDRPLPELKIGDYLVIHTAGAHGHAMGFQYNGKLRSAEILLHPDATYSLIRRAETLADYFGTLPEEWMPDAR